MQKRIKDFLLLAPGFLPFILITCAYSPDVTPMRYLLPLVVYILVLSATGIWMMIKCMHVKFTIIIILMFFSISAYQLHEVFTKSMTGGLLQVLDEIPEYDNAAVAGNHEIFHSTPYCTSDSVAWPLVPWVDDPSLAVNPFSGNQDLFVSIIGPDPECQTVFSAGKPQEWALNIRNTSTHPSWDVFWHRVSEPWTWRDWDKVILQKCPNH